MSKGSINEMIGTMMDSIKEVVKVSTVVGNEVNAPDGSVIIPVTKVTCGFGATGVEIPTKSAIKEEYPFGGGSGGGLSIEPMGFMVLKEGNVRIVPMVSEQTTVEKVIDMVPPMVDKLNGIVKSYTDKTELKSE
ncbi:MAG: sporulation protein YtfJ [Ruminococcaceae bacterium]|jgi:sporulation protein YtfJ|nr:sporulation protein YtfJ [Oscillospiraceae bacterium]